MNNVRFLKPKPKLPCREEIIRQRRAVLNCVINLKNYLDTRAFCHTCLLGLYQELERVENTLKEVLDE